MADFISREAAIAAIRKATGEPSDTANSQHFVVAVRKIPAADVVEVVRCSVCKKVLIEKTKDGAAYWCPVYHCYRAYDEFCNRGEK